MKDLVYSTPIEVLRKRVENAATTIRNNRGMLERVEESFRRRLHYCIDNNSGHFEHTKYIESLFGANQLSGKIQSKNLKFLLSI
jgi:ribosomal protein S6